MLTPLKRLAGQTAIYGTSSIIGRVLNYLLVPIYTRVFSSPDYGVVVEMYAYVAFLLVILTYGMETAFFRFTEKEKTNKDTVFSTTFLSVLSTSAIFILVVYFYSGDISALLRYPENPEYVRWLALIIGLDALSFIPFAKLRAENRAVRFAIIKFINIGVNITLNLFFIVFCPWVLKTDWASLADVISRVYDPQIGIGYIFISNLVATFTTVVLLLPQIVSSKWKFSTALWGQMILYAIPLLLGGLAGVANETIDKLFLKYLLPKDIAMSQVGIYGACYKISIMMVIFIQAFRYAAEPFFFAQAKEKDARQLYSEILKYFVMVCLVIFLAIMLFIDIVQHFVGEEYREGLIVVPVLLLAKIFLGIYFNLSVWYKITGRTHFGAIFAVFGAIITILLNIWWIPIFGYVGSAWATLICYFSMTLLSYFIGKKYYPVKYKLSKILTYIVFGVSVYLVSIVINDFVTLPYYYVNSALLGFFMLVLFLSDKLLRTSLFGRKK